jgi:hypothetical protein
LGSKGSFSFVLLLLLLLVLSKDFLQGVIEDGDCPNHHQDLFSSFASSLLLVVAFMAEVDLVLFVLLDEGIDLDSAVFVWGNRV